MEVPETAISWLAAHSSSNAELATFSNVCRKWRDCVAKVIFKLARESLAGGDDADDLSLLLLPSMVRYILSKEKETDNKVESYCLAWFNPSGIKFKQLPLEDQEDSDFEDRIMTVNDHRGSVSPQQFAPGGEHMYVGSEDEKKKTRRQPSRSTTPTVNSLNNRLQRNDGGEQFVNCLYQWDGCKTPEEVLEPFGYSTVFIEVGIWYSVDLIPFMNALCNSPANHALRNS